MKQSTFQFSLPSLCMALGISLLTSCSEKNEVITPDIAPENKEILAPAPVEVEAPSVTEVIEKTDSFLFPGQPSANARISGAGVADYVDFDDELALTIIPGQAANTFATAPYYIQQVGNAWVHVKETNNGSYSAAYISNHGHYHLGYQHFTPCNMPDGTFGKPTRIGDGCRSINPVKQARELSTHDGNQWIKIYAYDYTNPNRVFDLQGIKVNRGPIRLRYRKQNGAWFEWGSLGVGTWNLAAFSSGITEVLISATHYQSISFDDVHIKMPNF